MPFLTGGGKEENTILNGANAPREVIVRNALRVARPVTRSTPNNAKATNYRGVMAGSKDVTAIQAAYVNAIIRNKTKSGTAPGNPTWTGKLFTG